MLKFILLEETPKKVVYEYYPENGTDVGIVSFDKKAKVNSIVVLAANDKHKRYALKLFSRIIEFSDNNFFQKEGIIAWYWYKFTLI